MRLGDLHSKKLIFVSGKGGVGKTTVSLALALTATRTGKKVLLAKVNSEEDIGSRDVELLPNLWTINVQPNEAFKEYVLLQIKFKTLYRAVFENRLVRHFIEATPGLADLMCIGKIYERVGAYDLTIVDAPASGHSIALLQIASIVANAVRIGPLKTQAAKIDQMLHDPAQTMIVGVTLPEEMPVAEIVEMEDWLHEKIGLDLGPVFLNQVEKTTLTRSELKDVDPEIAKVLELQIGRAERSKYYTRQLSQLLPAHPIVPIPFIYSSQFGLTEIKSIADEITREFA